MKVVTAPNPCPPSSFINGIFETYVFLAGSIEQGKARPWQRELMQKFSNEQSVTFFNPRRDVWDDSWSQVPENDKLVKQIRWELEHIEKADIIFFYFEAGTQSPISMLELGMVLGSGATHVVIVCEPGFWREANVIETARWFDKQVFKTLDEGIADLRSRYISYS